MDDHIFIYKQKVWKFRPAPNSNLQHRFRTSAIVSKKLIDSVYPLYTDFIYDLNTKLTKEAIYVIKHSDLSKYFNTRIKT